MQEEIITVPSSLACNTNIPSKTAFQESIIRIFDIYDMTSSTICKAAVIFDDLIPAYGTE